MPRRPDAGGEALTELVLKVFALNGRFLEAAEELTAGTPLTAARWQVLGAVLRGPLTVSGIARSMGLARQSVQRLADALVADGLCAYEENPAHKRAKLLAPTAAGLDAIARIRPITRRWRARVAAAVGEDALREANAVADALLAVLDSPTGRVRPAAGRGRPRPR